MLLYLATAPLLPPCLKIAVNYKCSLNVSSDPEMQVGVRRRDSASPSLKRPRRDFAPSLSPFSLCFLLSPPPPLLLCLLHSPPLRFFFPFFSVFLHSSFPPSLVFSYPSVAFHRHCGSERGYGDRGFSSFPPSRERAATRHWRPCETASVCRLNVRHTESLCISPQLPLLVQPQEWDVEREGM